MSTRRQQLTQFAALLIALLSSACASTIIRSGLPPGATPQTFDERWHPAFFFGAVPLHPGYDLDQICPAGWAELRFGSDEFTFAASLLTLFLYSPSRITVVCAAQDAARPPPLDPYAPPRLGHQH